MQFECLQPLLIYQNCINEEITSRLASGNVLYHSVQNILSSSLQSQNRKIKTYRTIILPFVLYRCETWSLALGKEHRLRMFEKRVLRKICRPQTDEGNARLEKTT